MQAAGGTALTRSQNAGHRPPRRLGALLAVAAFVYVADVISKIVVVATLSSRPPIRLLGGFLTLTVLRNSGAAFSIGTSMTVVFTIIAAGVIFIILRMSRRLRSLPWAIALGLLLGGATGNLTDRLVRSPGVFRGDVVDWIQLPHWPVFNIADSAIVCGVILWALLLARGVPLTGRGAEPGTGDGGTEGADAGAGDGGEGAGGAATMREGDAHGGAAHGYLRQLRPGETGVGETGVAGAGRDGTRQDGAGPGEAVPGETGVGGTGQDGAGPGEAAPGGAVPGETGVGGAGRDGTRQDGPPQGGQAPDLTGTDPHSAVNGQSADGHASPRGQQAPRGEQASSGRAVDGGSQDSRT